MALEDLAKKDLVAIARKLDQENKELSARFDKVGAKADTLPYRGLSLVEKGDSIFLVQLKFDLDTKTATVENTTEFPKRERHMAEYRAKELLGSIARLDSREVK